MLCIPSQLWHNYSQMFSSILNQPNTRNANLPLSIDCTECHWVTSERNEKATWECNYSEYVDFLHHRGKRQVCCHCYAASWSQCLLLWVGKVCLLLYSGFTWVVQHQVNANNMACCSGVTMITIFTLNFNQCLSIIINVSGFEVLKLTKHWLCL